MSDHPLVSIVIPVYNGANFLSCAIESALAQTYPAVEVIVVNDGSTDAGATHTIAQQFGERIRYFSKPNGGVATALNMGIAKMRGELFSWLSHDDFYKPGKIAAQVDAWRSFGQPCIVIGDVDVIDGAGNQVARNSVAGRNLIARPLDAVFGALINGCSLLVPRNLFETVGVFDPGLPTTQDYYLWYQMARVVPFVHCPHADLCQRVHPLQGSNQPSHPDEASRMFIHLIHSTPVAIMEAYDGSELRFLNKILKRLGYFSGLGGYLHSRMDTLLSEVRYSVVLCAEGAQPPIHAMESLGDWRIPPTEIVWVGNSSKFGHILFAAEAATATEILVFLQSWRLPSEASVRAALKELAVSDVDVVRPTNLSALVSSLDGWAARRDSLPLLRAALMKQPPDWEDLSRTVRTSTYEVKEPVVIQTADELSQALSGKIRTDYHRGLLETAVVQLITDGLNPELPTILFLSEFLCGRQEALVQSFRKAIAGRANCLIGHSGAGRCLHLFHVSDIQERRSQESGLVFRIPEQLPILIRILCHSKVGRVDVHYTTGFDAAIENILQALPFPFEVTMANYDLLADESWLRRDELLLRKAQRVITIGRDLATRIRAFCPSLPVVSVQPWPELQPRVQHVFRNEIRANEPLRVVVIGSMSLDRDRELILEASRIIARRNLPIHFHVIGQFTLSMTDRKRIGNIFKPYELVTASAFSEILGRIDPQLGWLPAQSAEVWIEELRLMLEAGLPIAATAIGAISERCYGRPATWLLPPDTDPLGWVEFLLRLHATGLQEPPVWKAVDHLLPARTFYFEEYLRRDAG